MVNLGAVRVSAHLTRSRCYLCIFIRLSAPVFLVFLSGSVLSSFPIRFCSDICSICFCALLYESCLVFSSSNVCSIL